MYRYYLTLLKQFFKILKFSLASLNLFKLIYSPSTSLRFKLYPPLISEYNSNAFYFSSLSLVIPILSVTSFFLSLLNKCIPIFGLQLCLLLALDRLFITSLNPCLFLTDIGLLPCLLLDVTCSYFLLFQLIQSLSPVEKNPQFVLFKFVSDISLNLLSLLMNELGDDSVNLFHRFNYEFCVSSQLLLEFILSFPIKYVVFFVLFLSIPLRKSFGLYAYKRLYTGELQILSWQKFYHDLFKIFSSSCSLVRDLKDSSFLFFVLNPMFLMYVISLSFFQMFVLLTFGSIFYLRSLICLIYLDSLTKTKSFIMLSLVDLKGS